MIIFGTRARHKTVDTGEFFCLHCQQTRAYEHKQGKNYFALYFIPLFPIGEAGEFIECQKCHRSYGLEVLNFKPSKPQSDVARTLNTVKKRLESGYSIEYLVREMTVEGFDREIAENMVKIAIGDKRKACPNCDLTYVDTVKLCRECGVWLD